MRGGIRQRRLPGRRGGTGLVSSIGPVAVGVVLAFAWNMAASHQPDISTAGSDVAPKVEVAVEQAADQAWASTTPSAAPSRSQRSGRPARTSCSRVTPLRLEATGQVRSIGACSPRSVRPDAGRLRGLTRAQVGEPA